jgi:hypothetical protein
MWVHSHNRWLKKQVSGTLTRCTGNGGQGTGKRTLPICWVKQWMGEDCAHAVCEPGAHKPRHH